MSGLTNINYILLGWFKSSPTKQLKQNCKNYIMFKLDYAISGVSMVSVCKYYSNVE